MEEEIRMIVIVKDNEGTLSFRMNNGSIELYLDDKMICEFDWEGNFEEVIERMLVIWKATKEDI